jgi:hypothetical protein
MGHMARIQGVELRRNRSFLVMLHFSVIENNDLRPVTLHNKCDMMPRSPVNRTSSNPTLSLYLE